MTNVVTTNPSEAFEAATEVTVETTEAEAMSRWDVKDPAQKALVNGYTTMFESTDENMTLGV